MATETFDTVPLPHDGGPAAPRTNPLMLMIGLPIAIGALWVALLPALLVVLALKLTALSPGADVAGNLGMILGVGALFAMVTNPIAGRLSDRTTGRFGMRRPWIIGGLLFGSAALMLVALGTSVPMLLVGWCGAQVGFNAAFAGLIAVMPDQVSPAKRGRVAAAIGIANSVSVVFATYIVQLFTNSALQIIVPLVIGVAIILVFTLTFKDRVLEKKPTEKLGLVNLLGSFVFNPRTNPDLGWAWLTRFFMISAQSVALTYLPLFLTEHVGLSSSETASGVFYASLANTTGLLATTFVAGWLSDKLGRRKIFVIVAGIVAVAGLLVIAVAPSIETVILGQFLMGAGMGAFFAVDLALIADVLTSNKDNGKDFGVVNIAQSLPQSLVPAAAPAVIGFAGYPGLFISGAIVGILGALSVTPVKKVR